MTLLITTHNYPFVCNLYSLEGELISPLNTIKLGGYELSSFIHASSYEYRECAKALATKASRVYEKEFDKVVLFIDGCLDTEVKL